MYTNSRSSKLGNFDKSDGGRCADVSRKLISQRCEACFSNYKINNFFLKNISIVILWYFCFNTSV